MCIRDRFKGVSLRHRTISTNEKIDFPRVDQFDWFFKGPGRKGRGPTYISFNLSEASMTSEFAKKIEELTEGKTGVERIMNRYTPTKYNWIREYLKRPHPTRSGRSMKEVIFPRLKPVRYNQSVNQTNMNSLLSSFILSDQYDLNKMNLTLKLDPAYLGMMVYYRSPTELFGRSSRGIYSRRNLTYIFPSGESYLHKKGESVRHDVYDTTTNKFFSILYDRHTTPVLSGELKQYNTEQITY